MNILEIIEIRDKLKADLSVVEKFLEIAKSQTSNGSRVVLDPVVISPRQDPAQTDLRMPELQKEYGTVADMVREGIKHAPDKYTIRDVSNILQKIGKPLTKLQIATALTRFARNSEIHVHRKGKGSRPTVFKKEIAAAA